MCDTLPWMPIVSTNTVRRAIYVQDLMQALRRARTPTCATRQAHKYQTSKRPNHVLFQPSHRLFRQAVLRHGKASRSEKTRQLSYDALRTGKMSSCY